MLLFLLILVELGAAGFIFFDKSWREVRVFLVHDFTFTLYICCHKSDESLCQEIPSDKTGNFDTIYEFLEDHWKIIKWVALGAVILEVRLRTIYMVCCFQEKRGEKRTELSVGSYLVGL